MPTNESSQRFEKLSADEIDRVLGQFKTIQDAGELRPKADVPEEPEADDEPDQDQDEE